MFKKIAFFALFLAVTGLFAATSVNAQRLIKGGLVKSVEPTVDTLIELNPEAQAAVNLDQCQNGANTVPITYADCGAGWVNGNANGNNSHYAEGTNIHYRAIFTDLVPGTTYTVTFGFDKTHSSGGGDYTKNAIDYLNNYDATAVGYDVDPCFNGANNGTPYCAGDPTFIPILDDPGLPFDPAGRSLAAWGIEPLEAGEGFSVVSWVSPTSNTTHEQQFSVTFTAASSTVVLAWSGHIARAGDWNTLAMGFETSASSINGSPYHMRIIANTGWGGQQDRSLSTTAVVTPSAAGVNITGRVTDYYGRGISSAKLTLADGLTGQVKVAYTNTFGFYSFKDVAIGDFFTMTAQHRYYRFATSSFQFSLQDNIDGMNFTALR